MGKVCRGPRSLVLSAGLCVALAGGLGGVAAASLLPPDPPLFVPHVVVSPRVLSKVERGPAALHATVRVKERDDFLQPATLNELSLELDKDVSIETGGLTLCRRSQLLSLSTSAARKHCRDSVVGKGDATIRIYIHERPLDLESQLLIFNGGARTAETKLFLRTYITIPVPTVIVIPVTVKRIARGHFGSIVAAAIPKIANGSGLVVRLNMKFDREYNDRGKKLSVVSARCRTGRLWTRVSAEFQDEEAWQWEQLKRCTAGAR